jgi:hypothetical protein
MRQKEAPQPKSASKHKTVETPTKADNDEEKIPKRSFFFKEGQENVPFWHKQVRCLLL